MQAIKGQALADFIVECTPTSKAEIGNQLEWLMFVYGAASSQGSNAKIVLIPLEGKVLEYSLRFAFPNLNNMDEYEALIIVMKLAWKLEMTWLMAYNNSQ